MARYKNSTVNTMQQTNVLGHKDTNTNVHMCVHVTSELLGLKMCALAGF